MECIGFGLETMVANSQAIFTGRVVAITAAADQSSFRFLDVTFAVTRSCLWVQDLTSRE